MYSSNIPVNNSKPGNNSSNGTSNTTNNNSSSNVTLFLEGNDTKPQIYWAELKHSFISRCYLLSDLYPIFYICSSLFLTVTVVWSVFVFIIRKNTSYSFQRLITSIPILMLIGNFLYGKWYAACPWVDMIIST